MVRGLTFTTSSAHFQLVTWSSLSEWLWPLFSVLWKSPSFAGKLILWTDVRSSMIRWLHICWTWFWIHQDSIIMRVWDTFLQIMAFVWWPDSQARYRISSVVRSPGKYHRCSRLYVIDAFENNHKRRLGDKADKTVEARRGTTRLEDQPENMVTKWQVVDNSNRFIGRSASFWKSSGIESQIKTTMLIDTSIYLFLSTYKRRTTRIATQMPCVFCISQFLRSRPSSGASPNSSFFEPLQPLLPVEN